MNWIKGLMQGETTTKSLRSFGLMVGGVFALIGLWPAIIRGETPRHWALALAALLVIPALVFPRSLGPAYRVWMTAGHVLGWINTKILLGATFFLLFTPMGLVRHLFTKDPLGLKFEPGIDTYRVVRTPRPGSHMKHQF